MNEPNVTIVLSVLSVVDPDNDSLPRMTPADWERILDDICDVIDQTREAEAEGRKFRFRMAVDGVNRKTGLPIYTLIDPGMLTYAECQAVVHGLRPESELSDLERECLDFIRQAQADAAAGDAPAVPVEIPVTISQEVSND